MIGKRGAIAASCWLALALALAVDGYCFRKNPPRSQDENLEQQLQQPGNYSIWVCVHSHDLSLDLDKAPKPNITQIWFSMSNVEKLNNDAFAKFAEKLVKIEIWGSKLAEIEDGALKGLKELKGLILPRNELTMVKAAWFKDTPKLLELNLMNNRISSIEIESLKHLPALINLDLRGNELTVLPGDFVKQLPGTLRRLNLFNNPLNYRQLMEAVEWSKSKEDKTIDSKLKELKHVFNLTKGCLDDKAIVDKTNEAIDKCVEEKMRGQIELAASANNNGTAKV